MSQNDSASEFEIPQASPSQRAAEPRNPALRFRVDGPHLPFTSAAPTPQPERPAGRRDPHVLLEATQMLQRLQEEMAEQDQREAELLSGEEKLVQDREAFDQWATRIRTELEERRNALAIGESTVMARLAALENRLTELDTERTLVQAEREQLDQAKWTIEHELQTRLKVEREELQALRQNVADEFTNLQVARSNFEEEQAAAEQERAAILQQERQQLWSALTTEWQQHRQEFEAERRAWVVQRQSQDTELKQLRDRYDQALLGLETQLTNRRAAAEAELRQRHDDCEHDLKSQRAAWNEEQARQKAEQQRERVQWETRLRFQSEHLDKVRQELEAAQAEFKLERQRERQVLEDDARQLERLRTQTQLFRESIDAQAQSLERERQALLKSRKAWDSSVETDRAALLAERDAWEQEHRREQIELQRQSDAIASHAETLERKRQRLDVLRTELEDTHRSTLELRLAVEEAWAMIADALGSDDEARMRVDQARQALVLYYQELHTAIASQREDLLEQQARFDQQRLVFHDERQTLMNWLNDRDEQLRQAEEQLRLEQGAITQREQDWQKAQDQWLMEKLSAESLIRKLLGELGDALPEGEIRIADNAETALAAVNPPHFLQRTPQIDPAAKSSISE
ncbi:hypothetical protein GC163_17520 [bacterium]|nr:hypothetical protein [bacterium]